MSGFKIVIKRNGYPEEYLKGTNGKDAVWATKFQAETEAADLRDRHTEFVYVIVQAFDSNKACNSGATLT